MTNDNLRRVHKTLLKEGYTPPEYKEFVRDMQDDDNLHGVYETLLKEGYTPPEYEQFKSDMGFANAAAKPQPADNGEFAMSEKELEGNERTEKRTVHPAKAKAAAPITTDNIPSVQQMMDEHLELTRMQPVWKKEEELINPPKIPGALDDYREETDKSMQQMQRNVERMGEFTEQRGKYAQKQAENPLPADVQRIELGNTESAFDRRNPRVVESATQYNPITQKLEKTYLNVSGEYTNRTLAERDQAKIDKDIERRLKPLETQLADAYEERDRLNELARQRREELEKEFGDKSWLEKVSATANADKIGAPANRWLETDKQYQQYMAALRKNNELINTLEDAHNNTTNSFWHSIGNEIANGYTFSLGGAATIGDITAIANASKYADTITKKRKNDEPLTKEEEAAEAILKNAAWDNQAQLEYGDQYGAWARAGKMGATSLDMMFDFLMMGGLHKATATGILKGVEKYGEKALGKYVTNGLGKYMLKATGATLGTMVAGAEIANTIELGKVGAEAAHNYMGDVFKDEKGNYVFGHMESDGKGGSKFVEGGESIIGSILDAERKFITENASEVAGSFMPGGKLMIKGMEKIGLSKIANWLTAIGNRQWYKTLTNGLEKIGFNGIIEEPFEEYVGTFDDFLLGGDEWKNLADKRTHIDIWLGCATMGAFLSAPRFIGTGAEVAQYYRYKHKTDEADKVAAFRLTNEVWEPIRDKIDGATNSQMTDVLIDILSNNKFTKEEWQAVTSYVKNLQEMRGYDLGRIAADERTDSTKPQTEEEQAAKDVDKSYAEGYNTNEPEDKIDAKNRYEILRQRAIEAFSEEDINLVDNYPISRLFAVANANGYTEKEKQLLLDYVNAKATYDGMIQQVRDDIDGRIAESDRLIGERISKTDGMIHPATLKAEERPVYIVGGQVVLSEDGSIDRDKSLEANGGDGMLLIRDENTGKIETADIGDFLSVDAPLDAEEERRTAQEAIRLQFAQQAADEIDGVLPFNDGDVYDVLDEDGQQHTIEVVPAGEVAGTLAEGQVLVSVDDAYVPQLMKREEVQKMVDAYNLARLNEYEQTKAAQKAPSPDLSPEEERSEGSEVAATEPQPTEQTADENAMPMVEVNGKMKPDFNRATPERAHQYIYNERGLTRDEADAFVKANIDAISKEIEKQEKKAPKMGTDIDEYTEQKAAWQADMDALNARKKYWEDVSTEQKNVITAEREASFKEQTADAGGRQNELDAQKKLDEKIASAKQMYGEYFDSDFTVPYDAMELVAMNMPAEKLSWEGREGVRGLQQELGSNHTRGIGNNGSTQAFNQYLAKKGEGIGVDKAIHDIWESPMNQLPSGEQRWDIGDVREAFLDILRNATKPSDIRNYVYNNRVRMAEEMRAAEQEAAAVAQMDEEIRQRTGMEPDEYAAWIAELESLVAAQEAYEAEVYNETNTDNDTGTKESPDEASAGEVQGQEGNAVGTEEAGAGGTGEGSDVAGDISAGSQQNTAIAAAEADVDTNPTEAQKEAGNYKKGHVKIDGYDVTIEQPKGSVRRGVDANGKEWEQVMNNTYGYIRGTEGVDGDHIDVFLSDHIADWNGMVYVIDQVNKDGSFDEHKVMYGFNSAEEASAAYLSNYEEGWQGLGAITGVTKDEFKKWVESSHRKTKPFADYKSVKPTEGQNEGVALKAQQTEQRVSDSVSDTNIDNQVQEFVDAYKKWGDDVHDDALYKAYKDAQNRLHEMMRAMSDDELAVFNEKYGKQYGAIADEVRKEQGRRLNEARINKSFEDGLQAQGEITGTAKAPKVATDSFTSKDETRQVLNGVYHDESGYAVATDGRVLVADKSQYDEGNKGKIVASHKVGSYKKGDVIPGNYPKWRMVVDGMDGINTASVAWDGLRNFLAGVEDTLKSRWKAEKESNGTKESFASWSESAIVAIRMPNGEVCVYNYDMLRAFADAAASMGMSEITYGAENPLKATNDNGVVMLMPVNPTSIAEEEFGHENEGRRLYYEWGGAEKAQASKPAANATGTVAKKASGTRTRASKVGKIDDFGEKIGGARKDVARGRIRDTKKMTVKDLTTLKKGADDILSQTNIMRLYKDGQMDEQTARGFMALNNAAKVAMKHASPTGIEFIMTKYRDAAVAWEEGKPVVFEVTDEDVKAYQSQFGVQVTDEKARESLDFLITDPYNMFMQTYEAIDYPAVERKLGQYVIMDYTSMKGRHWTPSRPYWVKNGLRAQRGYPFGTMESAVAELKKLCPEVTEKEKKARGEKAEHGLHVTKEGYSFYIKSRNIPGNIYLSPKFWTEKEAQKYLDDNFERLKEREQRLVDALMGSNIGMAEREGVDYRNGKDVTPQDFLDEFGFRGVEFGNWVPQGERQMYLNKTYDAIKDFCAIVGISPRAFSLGGRLGLAFGARGKSRAMAHYEPGKEVINLTRMSGVGSLAHEWFHALDNYLAKQKTGNMSDMATETHDVVREELGDVFKEMFRAMRALDYDKRSRRAGEYWGRTVEEFARLFENYIYNKLAAKETTSPVLVREDVLLDNIGEDLKNSWPYPSAEENAKMEPYFDKLFDTIQEKTDANGNVVLFQKVDGSTIAKEADAAEEALRDEVIRLMREAGIEISKDWEEGQRVLDAYRELVMLMGGGKKKTTSETAKAQSPEGEQAYITDISDADSGAKVIKNIEKLAKDYEKKSNQPRTFLEDVAEAIGAVGRGSKSKYLKFKAKNGRIVVLRLANHNASVRNFDNNNEEEGVSIVVSGTDNNGVENNGLAHLVEFFYQEKDLRKADGKPLVEIIRSIEQMLYSGEYNDTTGLAKAEEVNADTIREMRAYHGSGADFDAFDHSFIGTGEGNQAFGWGTYVSDVEGVGRGYAKRIGDMKVSERKYIEGKIEEAKRYNIPAQVEYWENELKRKNLENAQHYLYEVEIPEDNGSNYIDYFAKMRDQQGILDKVDDYMTNNEVYGFRWERQNPDERIQFRAGSRLITLTPNQSGADLYEEFKDAFGAKPASEILHAMGITGIKVPVNAMRGGNENGEMNYVIFDENDLKITDKIKFFRTSNGEAYGFTLNGKIYLDPRIATSETPIHEYAHLWAQALRQANPEAWEKLKDEMRKEQDVMDYVKRLYPEITDEEELIEEVFTHYSGKRGAERLRNEMREEMAKANGIIDKARVATVFAKLRDMLSRFWNMARDLFAGKNENLSSMNGEDFADMMMNDLMSGFKPDADASGTVAARDMEYAEAANARDTEKAQKMVDEAARKAMPNTKIVDEDGNPLAVYHGTTEHFTVFDRTKGRANMDIQGMFFSPWELDAKGYGQNVRKFYVNITNPASFGEALSALRRFQGQENAGVKAREYLISKGYDGVNNDNEEYIAFFPEQIKSADAFTYDDAGNLIPLSRRFDESNNDIRYQFVGEHGAAEAERRYNELNDRYHGKPYSVITSIDEISDEDFRKAMGITDEMVAEETPEQLHEAIQKAKDDIKKRKVAGGYSPSTRKIVIFAENIRSLDKIEEGFFHENIHGILHDLYEDTPRSIAERFYDVAQKEGGFASWEFIDKGYEHLPESKKEEFFVYSLSRAMAQGRVGDILDVLADEDAERVENILSTIGYDRRTEETRRAEKRGKGNEVQEEVQRNLGQNDQGLLLDHDRRTEEPARKSQAEENTLADLGGVQEEQLRSGGQGEVQEVAQSERLYRKPMFREGSWQMSYEDSLAASKEAGYTKRQHDAWWSRQSRNKRNMAEDMAAKMHLTDRVTIVDSADELDGMGFENLTDDDRQSKGWFDPKTGKIVVILGNHASPYDVLQTMLHEGVNHYGLRELFGKNFNTFLDNVYEKATPEIRAEIARLARNNGWNFHTATEEYLGKLAEDTDFENAEKKGWWHEIKKLFFDMLHSIGLSSYGGAEISDNELRYILWRSYQNLVTPGSYRNLFDVAKDIAKQYELGVGRFDDNSKLEIQNSKLKAAEAAEPTDQQRMEYAKNAIKKYPNTIGLFKGSDGFYHSTDNNMRPFAPRALDEVMQKLIKSGKRVAVIDDILSAAEQRLHRDGDETKGIWADKTLGLQEQMTETAARLANENSEDKVLRGEAMRAIGANLSDLRKAMSLQRHYDRTTVKRVADLSRILIDGGYLNDLSQQEVKRLLSALKDSTGKEEIDSSVQKVMDIMVDNQLKHAESVLHQLETIKGSKVDARGVEVQGQLDPTGQQIIKVFKKMRGEDKEDINNALSEAQERMGSEDAAIAETAALEYAGLQFALEYAENIKESKAEERELRKELENRHAETSHDYHLTDEYKEYKKSVEDAIRQNKAERVQAYYDLVSRLSGNMRESMANAAAFKEAEKQRVREIQHNANSDMEGRPSNEHYKPKFLDKFVNNPFVRFFFAPLATFDQVLRLLGSKSANGEGYLYNRFMRGWVDARQKEIRGVRSKYAVLDAKANELFGSKVKTWGDLIRKVGKMPKASVSFWDGGEMREHELTQGNLLYIYMVNKMLDGRMKLRKMGITEEDVENIERVLDPRLIKLAEWMQEEFLVETRNEYNETHKRMFGASMAAVEHYFPLKILANARADKPEDLDNPEKNEGISTATGSIIKRRRNALALDITGADALNVILDHVTQMEHWNAFAEFNRDLNTLRTYKRFRNQVQNMTSVYGSGTKLWQTFNDLCQMAAGTYRPKRATLDETAVNLAKGVTAAKVSFRLFTALKQLLSAPAYISEARPDYLVKNIMTSWKAWNWSMEHLPIFNERWKSRIAGDPRLVKTELDWAGWRNNVVQIASRIGMSPNAFIDAWTVSVGAYSIYETKKSLYLDYGYSEEQAEKKAIQDAEIAYNQTQQSSEGAFLSTMQVDRSWLTVLFTIFRNASMAYQRQLHDAIRNIKRDLTPGNRNKSIEFMAKQFVRDGIDEEQAMKNANSRYNRQIGKDVVRVAIFGYFMQLLWNMGSELPYLLLGGDDDDKDKRWDDIIAKSYFGNIEGFTGGDVLSDAGKMLVTGEGNPAWISKDMPIYGDMFEILKKVGNKKYSEAFTDIVNLIVQAGIGVNPQSITDAVLAVMDACGGDAHLAHEATIFAARIMQVPLSQIDKLYFDDVKLSGKEAKGMTFDQLVKRYAEYKVKRENFFSPWAWDDEERLEKKSEKAYEQIKERLENMSDEDADNAMERNYSGDGAGVSEATRKAIGEAKAKRLGGTDYYYQNRNDSEHAKAYAMYRDYFDMAGDVLLQVAIREAKEVNDEERKKGIDAARGEINKLKPLLVDGKHDPHEVMEKIRVIRNEALEKYGKK